MIKSSELKSLKILINFVALKLASEKAHLLNVEVKEKWNRNIRYFEKNIVIIWIKNICILTTDGYQLFFTTKIIKHIYSLHLPRLLLKQFLNLLKVSFHSPIFLHAFATILIFCNCFVLDSNNKSNCCFVLRITMRNFIQVTHTPCSSYRSRCLIAGNAHTFIYENTPIYLLTLHLYIFLVEIVCYCCCVLIHTCFFNIAYVCIMLHHFINRLQSDCWTYAYHVHI